MNEIITQYNWLKFLQKVACIMNIFFIICLFLRYTSLNTPEFLQSIAIILGWIISPVINVMLTLTVAILILKRGMQVIVSRWIFAFNLFMFGIQIFYFLLV